MGSTATEATSARLEHGDGGELRLGGCITLANAETVWKDLDRALAATSGTARVDLSDVEALDPGSAALLLRLRDRHEERGGSLTLTGAGPEVQSMLDLQSAVCRAPLQAEPDRPDFFSQVGQATVDIGDDLKCLMGFVGEFTNACLAAVRVPKTIHWKDLGKLTEMVGADGLPIIGLIAWLMGLILGFQAALQLAQYGADIFIADMVGLAIVRELGPLMAAIVLAGRSGAGFAAELGTMKVSEEIDALRTMGLCEYRFLVVPRTLALVIATPILTLIADLLGILGGLFIAVVQLGLTPVTYMNRAQVALDVWDFGSGLIKSVAFALLIAFVACERGLSTRGGAAGVGRSTTSAVVIVLFGLVIIDLLFTILYTVWGV